MICDFQGDQVQKIFASILLFADFSNKALFEAQNVYLGIFKKILSMVKSRVKSDFLSRAGKDGTCFDSLARHFTIYHHICQNNSLCLLS